ncbi:hypothetical protein CDG76_34735 [Nostoc sp. 'Peltigera membranacea cyanobiont' 210A]|uniref:hypothetical protein n=1 Tax=Nostoc sp. 'Peltigera membranacea cyanobiont' 210A TaxID=2014529 RepID=UPI000B9537B1|nr:hypothetical protein [Nostoc sp. 'Peltigera membranacea cyanobiont' 210A]OYD89558.1 hypothetical protein CDG76_34735 [Nostoc sp. 'Peltigera membranacea cyanobiont' 210A]
MKEAISQAFDKCRWKTFALFQDMTKPHSLVNLILTRSAVGCYLGHIAYIESLSLLEHST